MEQEILLFHFEVPPEEEYLAQNVHRLSPPVFPQVCRLLGWLAGVNNKIPQFFTCFGESLESAASKVNRSPGKQGAIRGQGSLGDSGCAGNSKHLCVYKDRREEGSEDVGPARKPSPGL